MKTKRQVSPLFYLSLVGIWVGVAFCGHSFIGRGQYGCFLAFFVLSWWVTGLGFFVTIIELSQKFPDPLKYVLWIPGHNNFLVSFMRFLLLQFNVPLLLKVFRTALKEYKLGKEPVP